jgi:hypothetical protein
MTEQVLEGSWHGVRCWRCRLNRGLGSEGNMVVVMVV